MSILDIPSKDVSPWIVPPLMAISVAMETLSFHYSLLRNVLLWFVLLFCFFTGLFFLFQLDFLLDEKVRSIMRIVPFEIFKVPSVVTNMLTSLGTVQSNLFI